MTTKIERTEALRHAEDELKFWELVVELAEETEDAVNPARIRVSHWAAIVRLLERAVDRDKT